MNFFNLFGLLTIDVMGLQMSTQLQVSNASRLWTTFWSKCVSPCNFSLSFPHLTYPAHYGWNVFIIFWHLYRNICPISLLCLGTCSLIMVCVQYTNEIILRKLHRIKMIKSAAKIYSIKCVYNFCCNYIKYVDFDVDWTLIKIHFTYGNL